MDNKLALTVLDSDQIWDLSQMVPNLPERSLKLTWTYIQDLKYNGMLEHGDCAQPNLIFNTCELPLIKRLYPPELVNPMVKKHVIELAHRAKEYSKQKFLQYREMRKAGVPVEKARQAIAPIHKEEFLKRMALKYSRPFTYQYAISCKDADMLYTMGLDNFIRIFYDRFYVPITSKKTPYVPRT